MTVLGPTPSTPSPLHGKGGPGEGARTIQLGIRVALPCVRSSKDRGSPATWTGQHMAGEVPSFRRSQPCLRNRVGSCPHGSPRLLAAAPCHSREWAKAASTASTLQYPSQGRALFYRPLMRRACNPTGRRTERETFQAPRGEPRYARNILSGTDSAGSSPTRRSSQPAGSQSSSWTVPGGQGRDACRTRITTHPDGAMGRRQNACDGVRPPPPLAALHLAVSARACEEMAIDCHRPVSFPGNLL